MVTIMTGLALVGLYWLLSNLSGQAANAAWGYLPLLFRDMFNPETMPLHTAIGFGIGCVLGASNAIDKQFKISVADLLREIRYQLSNLFY